MASCEKKRHADMRVHIKQVRKQEALLLRQEIKSSKLQRRKTFKRSSSSLQRRCSSPSGASASETEGEDRNLESQTDSEMILKVRQIWYEMNHADSH